MLAPIGLYYGTALTQAAGSGMFNAMDAEMALANNAGSAASNPAAVASLASLDKSMALFGAAAKVNYEVGLAMQNSGQSLMKKLNEQRQRLLQAGATFV